MVNHKNPVVRTTVSRLLAYTVDRMGVSKALSGAKDVTEKLLPAIAKLAQDGSQEARNYAKSTLHRMMIEKPDDFERILKRYHTSNALRNIEKILEALKNPHHSAKGKQILHCLGCNSYRCTNLDIIMLINTHHSFFVIGPMSNPKGKNGGVLQRKRGAKSRMTL